MRKRLRIPDIREMLVMLKNNVSPDDISRAMRVSKSCVYKWNTKFSEINFDDNRIGECLNKRGPKFKNFIEKESKLSEIISNDNSLTQRGMQVLLAERNEQVSQATISKTLKQINVTRKRLVLISEKKNDPENISLRHQYAVNYRRYDDDDILFLDETGFNLHTKRHYGYSPANLPARMQVKSSRGKNVTLLALISRTKVLNHKIINGPCNSQLLISFFEDCLIKNVFRANNIILMDNVAFHKHNEVRRFLNSKRLFYGYLPVYSPELNPIEEVFSMLKSNYYTLSSPSNYEEIARNIRIIINSWDENGIDFIRFYRHMREYLDKAFMRENF